MANKPNVPQVLKVSPEKLASAIKVEDIICQALKLSIVKVNRASFLRKELTRYYPKYVVDSAIRNNPAYAGISKKRIRKSSWDIRYMKPIAARSRSTAVMTTITIMAITG